MSDFLQLVDEVIDGTPEYTLTQKPNGKYDIELANVIIQQGTALNKASLNKVNAILGYNILIPQQEIVPDETTTLTNGNYAVNSLIRNNKNWEIYNRSSGQYDTIVVQNSEILIMSGTYIVEMPTNVSHFSIRTSYDANCKIYGSNDNVIFTQIRSVPSTTTEIQNTYKYYKNIGDGIIYFNNIKSKNAVINSYTYENINIDNQILLIKPSFTGSVKNNTLNDKQIDTLLKSNKYYELLYDEQNNRFIAEEVRA